MKFGRSNLKKVKDYYVKGAMSSFLGTISYLYPVLFLNLLRQKALYKNIETNSNQNLKFRCLDFFFYIYYITK